MPKETGQPFDKQPRSGADPELVEGVLGSGARADMEELVDGVVGSQEVSVDHELALAADELAAAAEAEKTREEKQRDEYIAWAVSFGENEGWVDQSFEFLPDGDAVLLGDLHIFSRGIGHLPKGMSEGEGKKFNARNNKLTTAEGVPEGLKDLVLAKNKLTSCEGIPNNYYEWLDLSNNPITDLSQLPKSVLILDLRRIQATSIPAGLNLDEIRINENQRELIRDAKAKGYEVDITTY